MEPNHTKGYDTPHDQREEDELDRWRFASEIVQVIESTPPDWSARIGVFGKWGEGKSTVLRFAEQMLAENGNVVFTFNPWAIQNWNDLWEDFGSRLSEALSSANIPFDNSWKKTAKESAKWLKSTGIAQTAEAVADVFGKVKLYNASFGLLGRWLRYDGEQIRAIRAKLKDRRLVVLIDDLDRCAPELIPQLLLSLRELLDLPGFTFLLAFDDEIVAQALVAKNPAWSSGTDFLEKILDFRFHLPAITDLQKQRLILKALRSYCPFVPEDSAKAIQDLLPSNPRKLKALIRSLAALSPQVSRHDPDELNWADMWLAQMLRLESFTFFERLLKDDTLEKEAGVAYEILKGLATRTDRGAPVKDENETLKALMEEAGVQNQTTVERLIKLIEAIRARGSFKFRYAAEMTMRPHAVTWKEFRMLHATWNTDPRASILADWIVKHSNERAVSQFDVSEELFGTILSRRHQVLSEASDAESIPEHDAFCTEAEGLLQMLDQFLLELGNQTAVRFRKVYDQAVYWMGFDTNSGDQVLRALEKSFLLKLLSGAQPELNCELLEQLHPWDSYRDELGDETRIRNLKRTLRGECVATIAPAVAREAIEFLLKEDSARSLFEKRRFAGYKYCLFHPESPIWTTSLQNELVEVIRRGSREPALYQNAHYLLDILLQAGQSGLDYVTRDDITAVLSHEEFVRALWGTITSKEIQYRMQMSILQARRFLIQQGVPESVLPLTRELQSRLEVEVTRANPAPVVPADAIPAEQISPDDLQQQ